MGWLAPGLQEMIPRKRARAVAEMCDGSVITAWDDAEAQEHGFFGAVRLGRNACGQIQNHYVGLCDIAAHDSHHGRRRHR